MGGVGEEMESPVLAHVAASKMSRKYRSLVFFRSGYDYLIVINLLHRIKI